MNPAFDMPYLPNPFAAPAEEPAPAPIPYMDTITIDQRPKRSQVALLEKLCMEKDAFILKLEEENKQMRDKLRTVKNREAQALLNDAATGMLNNIRRATLPPEAAPQSNVIGAGSQASPSGLKVTEVVTQKMDHDYQIGICFKFDNGMRHAFRLPMNAPMEEWVRGMHAMKVWADRYRDTGVVRFELSGE